MGLIKKLLWSMKRQNKPTEEPPKEDAEAFGISASLDVNIKALQDLFGHSSDLVLRKFFLGREDEGVEAALLFIDGLVSQSTISDSIIKPLMHDSRFFKPPDVSVPLNMADIREKLLAAGEVATVDSYTQIAAACLSGNAALLIEGSCKALDIGAKGWDKRSVTEPVSESSIRSSREGFTENLRSNTAMIRRKIKDPGLTVDAAVMGKRTQTQVNIMYLAGIVDPALVEEVKRRLRQVDTDAILAAGYIEQYIEDRPATIFPTIWSSEKPDAVAGKLLEGRVAVVVDGSPFVLTMPMLFVECFQNAEDYVIHSYYATPMRILRAISFFISLLAPALYIAFSTFHQELIPSTLLFSMAASSEGTPFPAAVEVSVMLLIFLILREAGLRMPRPIGQTISIVGALVMGEAAVQAGIVGAPVVIVVAITAVSSFSVPFLTDACSLLTWLLLVLATFMGSFGITVGMFAILVHLVSLRSFGAHYFAPFAPFQKNDLKDTGVRVPLWKMDNRPVELDPQDLRRQNAPPAYKAEKEGGPADEGNGQTDN